MIVLKLISEFWTKRSTTWLLLRWFLWAFFSVVVVWNFMNLPESIINYKTSIRGFLKVKSPRALMKSHERKCIHLWLMWTVDFEKCILKNPRYFSGGEKNNWWKKLMCFFDDLIPNLSHQGTLLEEWVPGSFEWLSFLLVIFSLLKAGKFMTGQLSPPT